MGGVLLSHGQFLSPKKMRREILMNIIIIIRARCLYDEREVLEVVVSSLRYTEGDCWPVFVVVRRAPLAACPTGESLYKPPVCRRDVVAWIYIPSTGGCPCYRPVRVHATSHRRSGGLRARPCSMMTS